MSTVVGYAPHSFGLPMGDTMARSHHGWSQDLYPPRQSGGSYYAQQQQQQQQQQENASAQPRERVQLPGPSALFSAAASAAALVTSSPSSASSPHSNNSVLPAAAASRESPPYSSAGRPATYYGGEYATPSPVGQTPPQLPAPHADAHGMPGPLALRTTVRGPDARFSPTQSPVSSVRSDDLDLASRFQQPHHHHQQQQQPQQQQPPLIPPQQPLPHLPTTPRYHSREPPAYHYQHHQHHQPPPPTSSPPVGIHQAKAAAAAYPTPNSRSSIYPPMHPSSPSVGAGRLPTASTSPRTEVKQMSITSLLSDEVAAAAAAAAASSAAPRSAVPPPPFQHHPTGHASATATTSKTPMLSPAQSVLVTSEYRIRVRQQPVAARSCGFGERDRRVIDPPPIVQLTIDDPDATPEEISMRLRFQFTVLHCSIWNETGEQDNSAMPEDYRQQRRLMGTLVSSPFVGQDEHGEEGCFFCFPDLSCRTPGSFRLKFALVVLDPLGMRAGGSSPIMATAMSDVFTVYNAKDFPGMQASTALTKRLKEQGCLISIKKGNEKTSAAHGRDESDGDDNDHDGAGDGAPAGKSRKRAKRA
ncbi:Velvet factor [Niveomyces insectorum RCEF 264]|uniref:Velvet factor n=1 Tax=Niveomyces insectorum RCEF 264 TaxID=1081102 RepID=A0A162I9L9_9HYPO|nr:Velvet factor [Niveomyces insectorum RCEF 264]